MAQKKYDREFKLEAICLASEEGHNPSEIGIKADAPSNIVTWSIERGQSKEDCAC